MLRFAVYRDGQPAPSVDLSGAYLVGSDGVPVRADIEFKSGEIVCRKRTAGPAGLALLWPFKSGARMMLETTRLPERDQPYNLHVELLRGRLMRVAQKREDWGLHDFEGTDEITDQIEKARDQLISALTANSPAQAAAAADIGNAQALTAAELLTAFHAQIFLNRRKQVGGFPKRLFGCTVDIHAGEQKLHKPILDGFEYVTIPFNWRDVEPREKEFNWAPYDRWVEWAAKNRVPIRGSGFLCFQEHSVPDWLYIWEHDFDAVRDLIYEHIRRIIGRYGQYIQVWEVISGIHAENCFSFNFEQLMELTRMSTAVTKQLAPRATTIVNLIAPWGEYYARNQRTIPPLLYAEMIVQSGVTFDAFGLQCQFGAGEESRYVRDLFQISAMLDRFSAFGKPIHLSAVEAPSSTAEVPASKGGPAKGSSAKSRAPQAARVKEGGAWHRDWNEETQRAWLRRVYHIALSKPYVEAITWNALLDGACGSLPHGGLLKADATAKPAFAELIAIRNELSAEARRATAQV
jgi:hypothetical protein